MSIFFLSVPNPSKSQKLDLVINSIKISQKNKEIAISKSLKRHNAKKDKFNEIVLSVESSQGTWVPTFPAYLNPLLPKFGTLNTNLEYNYEHLFNSLPKKIDIKSKDFLKQVEYVSKIGSKNSSLRTTDQTNIALFWAAGKGTVTPPGMWTKYALNEVQNMKSFYLKAYTMKTISNALMDSAIICWNLKYRYNLLRPITAVRNSLYSNWESLLITPNFPAFTSGHSTFSGSASIILDTVFNNKNITLESEGYQSRKFKTYTQAAEEAGMSRIYGGIHYPIDNSNGLEVGRKIGCSYLKERFKFKCSK